jgi:hypothetical protein
MVDDSLRLVEGRFASLIPTGDAHAATNDKNQGPFVSADRIVHTDLSGGGRNRFG